MLDVMPSEQISPAPHAAPVRVHSRLLRVACSTPVLVLALLLTVAGWVGVRCSANPAWVLVLDNLHWTSGYIAASVLAARAWMRGASIERNAMERTLAGWVALGLASMAVGQMVWNVQVPLDWTPFPGPSDFFFLLTGVLFSRGVWQVCQARLPTSALRALRLDALSLLTGVLCCSLMLYLPRQNTYTALQLAVMVAYPVCFALPPLLLLALQLSLRCRLRLSTVALPLLMLVFAALWGEWNRRFLQNQLIDGDWLNISFSLVAILMGAAAHGLRMEVWADAAWDRRCEQVVRLMPIIMVVLASSGVITVELVGGFAREVQWIGVAGALLAVALATIRQSYLLHDRDRMLAAEKLVSQRELELQNLNRELEDRVQQRTTELVQSQKLAALGALVAGVSHELNTPIGNIRIVASMLREDVASLSDKVRAQTVRRSDLDAFAQRVTEASAMIESGLERAVVLIQSFKQIAVDRTTEHRRSFDLHDVVEETMRVQRAVHKGDPCTISSDVPAGIAMDGYPGPLGQLLDILVDNAFLHAFGPGRTGAIRIEAATHDDGEVSLCVQDNGEGIPQENLHRLFDPFFTTKLGRGGSGLGLHVAWNLVAGLLGGRIHVSSAPGQGSRFEIRIPRRAP